MIQEFSEDVHTGCAGAGARTSRKELPEMNEITLPMEARLRAQTMALEETAQEPIDGGSIFVSMVVPNHTASEAVEDVQRMAAGAGIALGGKLIGRCIALVGNVVLAHILGPATFGLYAIGWTITKIATVLTPLGLDSGVIRFASPDLGQNHGRVKGAITQSLRISLVSGLTLGAVFYLLAPWVGENVFHRQSLIPVFRCFAFAFPLVTCLKVAAATTRVSQRMKFSVFTEDAGQPAAALLLILIFYLLGWKLGGALAAFDLSFGIALILAVHYIRKLFPEVSLKSVKPDMGGRELLFFSLPTSLSLMFGILLLWVDRLFVGYYCSPAEAGVYHAASQLSVALAVILSAFGAIVNPMIARLYHQGKKQRLEELYRISTKWSFYVSLPAFLVMCFVPRQTVSFIFGKPYAMGWIVLPILGVGQLINSGTGAVGGLLVMTGHQNALSVLSGVTFCANVLLAVVLVPRFGVAGAAVGTALTIALLCLVSIYMARRFLGLWPYDGRYWKGVMATGVASAGLLLLRLLPISSPALLLAAAIVVSGSLFSGVLLGLGLDAEDREFLHMMFSRLASGRRSPVA